MQHAHKNNILFLHLPKNGGATLNALLNRIFSGESVYQIQLKNNHALTTQDFIDMPLEARKKIKVLKGHMAYGLHEHLVGPSDYITFLRKPEKRIRSFYNFIQERPNHRLYDEVVKKQMSFKDFVLQMDVPDLHNAQIRYISGLHDADEATMLQTAMNNIENHFSFVGLQERYDESLILLKQLYGWGIPYYTFVNKGKNSISHADLDAETKLLIAQKNAGDSKLYKIIEDKFLNDLETSKHLNQEVLKLKYANELAKNRFGRKLLKITGL